MKVEPSSFRDPSGHLYWHDGELYRSITDKYINTYTHIKSTGFYDELVADNIILDFTEVSKDQQFKLNAEIPLFIKPKILPFISYPYEWSFSQLKDAALLTLDLHIRALKRNFLLKDASAYNVQFLDGKPIFIDHLSIDECDNYPVWPAYSQFCRHFLAPLVLMAKIDSSLNSLFKSHIDGIPLQLARSIIPAHKLFSFGLFIHLLCHAKSQQKHANNTTLNKNEKKLSRNQLLNLAESLKETTKKIQWKPDDSEWSEYYSSTNYSPDAMESKIQIVKTFTKNIPGIKTIWDLGGNIGEFSRVVQTYAKLVVCFDVDMAAVEANYLRVKKNGDEKILPLVMDFTNPSPAIGFASTERDSLNNRSKADLAIALALIHHLAISNNIPFEKLAGYLSNMCNYLIIEFVPKEDSQVKRLLTSRDDIFTTYDEDNFLKEFSQFFNVLNKEVVKGTKRTIFVMKSRC